MRGRVSKWIGLSLAILLSMAIAGQVSGQMAKQGRVSGVVQNISKDTSTITVRKGSVPKQVIYNNDTKFSYRGKASTIDDVKESRRVICIGTFNEKTQLVAAQIDVRSGK